MKTIKLLATLSLCAISYTSFSAKLCAQISNTTGWTGGVFSVIAPNGDTVATTDLIPKGGQGCTESFAPGDYVIRFTGAELSSVRFDGVFGCVTDVYHFDDVILNVVYNQGRPPFNANSLCFPTV